jgi:hypothetical protein
MVDDAQHPVFCVDVCWRAAGRNGSSHRCVAQSLPIVRNEGSWSIRVQRFGHELGAGRRPHWPLRIRWCLLLVCNQTRKDRWDRNASVPGFWVSTAATAAAAPGRRETNWGKKQEFSTVLSDLVDRMKRLVFSFAPQERGSAKWSASYHVTEETSRFVLSTGSIEWPATRGARHQLD